MLIGGLLPFSDASGYLADARRLSLGNSFAGLGNGHPIATGSLAVLWKCFHGDYRLTLASIALLDAASCWYAMSGVALSLGFLPAVLLMLVDYLFLRRFLGIPLSEHFGVMFCNIGVGLACRLPDSKKALNWGVFIATLTLAQMARPGALLTIPTLILGAFLFSPFEGFKRRRLALHMAASVCLILFLSKLLQQSIYANNPSAISDSVYVLHSLVLGGTWEDAMNRYGGDNLAVLHAVKLQLIHHPLSFFTGAIRSMAEFVQRFYLFSFVVRRSLNLALHFAFCIGVITGILQVKSTRNYWWMIALLCGLFFSMPLLPPWDTDGMRAYAASIPLIAFTASFGANRAFEFLSQKFAGVRVVDAMTLSCRVRDSSKRPFVGSKRMLFSISLLILGIIFAGPPLLRLNNAHRVAIEQATKIGNDSRIVFELLPRASLMIVADDEPRASASLRITDFREGLKSFAELYPAEAELLHSLPSGNILFPDKENSAFVAIDAHGYDPALTGPIPNRSFSRLAAGRLLIFAQDSLIDRSPDLAAYRSPEIAQFNFGHNRFPVIRAGDTVLFSGELESIEPFAKSPAEKGAQSALPMMLDRHRLRFPLTGKYRLRINGGKTIKVLVVPRNCTSIQAMLQFRDFISVDCIDPGAGKQEFTNDSPFENLERWFKATEPVKMTPSAIDGIVELLGGFFVNG